MGAGLVSASDLDEFVAECDRRGGIASPEAAEYVADFSLSFVTDVDADLDGYSEEYARMQLDLYREIAGRDIDQHSNEMHELDVAEHVGTANPYASADCDLMAKHARTILTSVVVADLPPGATVLDMGCGWGISTEMFGFCGCRVTAIDINPLFVDLVARRSAARGYDVEAQVCAFEDFESNERFDLIFFYESFHHAIYPWQTIDRLSANVNRGGKFVLAGEPIQELWWSSWGLRLDAPSVYCMRKFGWFESGWSEAFISDCFRRSGFELTLLPGIGFQHSPIGVAVRPDEHAAPPTAHWAVPLAGDAPESAPRTGAGARARGLASRAGTFVGRGGRR